MAASNRFYGSPKLYRDENQLSSSPDPLATSAITSSPVKRAVTPSPRKRRSTKILQDVTFSTPQKTKNQSTEASKSALRSQTEGILSPWKIRVTVEAEPEEEKALRGRKQKFRQAPFSDGSSSPSKRSKGRVRNRSGSRKSENKGTTVENLGKVNRRDKLANLGRLTDFKFHDENIGCENKAEGGSKNRRSDKPCESVEEGLDTSETPVVLPPIPRKSNERGQEYDGKHDSLRNGPQPRDSSQIRELDLNSASARDCNGAAKTTVKRVDEEDLGHHAKPSSSFSLSAACLHAAKDEDLPKSMASTISYPTPVVSVEDDMKNDTYEADPVDGPVGFDTILESESFTMIDLESIPSARHFVTTPSDAAQQAKEPQAGKDEIPGQIQNPTRDLTVAPLLTVSSPILPPQSNDLAPTHMPSYLFHPEDDSDISSAVPSSPPVDDFQPICFPAPIPFSQPIPHIPQTPDHFLKSSPNLPSPPRLHKLDGGPASKGDAKSTPPPPRRVVRAGNALQGLLSPRIEAPRSEPLPMKEPVDNEMRNPFSTKQPSEIISTAANSNYVDSLGAGLELSKKQHNSSDYTMLPDAARSASSVCHGGLEPASPSAPAHQDLVEQNGSELRTATPGDRGDSATTNYRTSERPSTPFNPNMSCGSIYYLNTAGRERRWQLEREAISRQIENANSSQVIVIDSDDEEEAREECLANPGVQASPAPSANSEADEDIWLAEAGQAQHKLPSTEEDLFPRAEQLRQRERARNFISRPRRSVIPSPWKRGQDIESAFITDDDVSSTFQHESEPKNNLGSLPSWLEEKTKTEATEGDVAIGKTTARRLPSNNDASSVPAAAAESSNRKAASSEDAARVIDAGANIDERRGNDEERGQQFRSNIAADLVAGCDEEDSNEPSLTPPPVKIAVNFNDVSDVDVQCALGMEENTQLHTPPSSPCRPYTPRSAMKGSRASLQDIQEDSGSPTRPRVAFSRHSTWRDESGVESSMKFQESPLTFGSSKAAESSVDQGLASRDPPPCDTYIPASRQADKRSRASKSESSASAQAAPVSWFARLTDWDGKSGRTGAQASDSKAATRQQAIHPPHANSSHQTTDREVVGNALLARKPPASKFLPASSSSTAPDSRIPAPPETLSIEGYFSDDHYKHLHILYLKSLKPTFTRPASIRPQLKDCIGQKRYSGDGEFAWEITERDAEVVERWMRSFEDRRGSKHKRRLVWNEADLCSRLFSIVAGQELRREQREKGGST